MKVIKTLYHWFCVAEETVLAVFVAGVTFLVFFFRNNQNHRVSRQLGGGCFPIAICMGGVF